VLRGPQGTLFGKNTTGGAIAYYSQTPTNDVEGYVTGRFAGGNQSSQFIEGAINLPLIDNVLAARLSFQAEHEGYYVNDTVLNRSYGQGHFETARLQLRWTPSDATTVNLTLYGGSRIGDGPVYHGEYLVPCDAANGPYLCTGGVGGVGGVPIPAPHINPDTVALSNINQYENYSNANAVLRVEQAFGKSQLTSITSFKHIAYVITEDNDGLPGNSFNAVGPDSSKVTTQEVRFATDANKRLSAVVGMYFEQDHLLSNPAYTSVPNDESVNNSVNFVTRLEQTNETNTYAVFTNLTFKITDQVSFIGGVRKSEDFRSNFGATDFFAASAYVYSGGYKYWNLHNVQYKFGSPPVPPDIYQPYQQNRTWKPWTWDGTLTFNPTTDVLVFVRAAEGFRSGGFNSAPLFYAPILPPYDPEILRSYEIGFKSTLLNNTVEVNSSIYHYNFTNAQISSVVKGVLTTANAGAAKVDGAELEILARPIAPLEVRSSVAYTHSRFTEYQTEGTSYVGNPLPQAPTWTAAASAAYTIPVAAEWDLKSLVSWSYRTQVYFDQTKDPRIGSGSLAEGNVRLMLSPHGKGVSFAAFVNNVTNRQPVTYGYLFANEFYDVTFGLGRIYGGEITYRW
jgi:iron complex outermembrane receptor protein